MSNKKSFKQGLTSLGLQILIDSPGLLAWKKVGSDSKDQNEEGRSWKWNSNPVVWGEVTKEVFWKGSYLSVMLTGQSRNQHVLGYLPNQPKSTEAVFPWPLLSKCVLLAASPCALGGNLKGLWMCECPVVSECLKISLFKHALYKWHLLSNRKQLCHWRWQDEVRKKAGNNSAAYQAASSSFLLKAPSVLSPLPTRGKVLHTRIHNSKHFKLNCPRSWITSANVSQHCGTPQSRGFKQDSLKTGIVPSSVQK